MFSTALALFASTALAEESAPEPTARLLTGVRASLAVPAGYAGLATSYSAEVGAQFKNGQSLALRLAFVPDPPDVYQAATPDFAMGPVVTWAYHVRVSSQLDVSPTVSLGAVFGASPVDQTNMVLPYVQGGLGMRYRVPLPNGGDFYIMPEAGIVPTILAPLVAINVGIIGKPS